MINAKVFALGVNELYKPCELALINDVLDVWNILVCDRRPLFFRQYCHRHLDDRFAIPASSLISKWNELTRFKVIRNLTIVEAISELLAWFVRLNVVKILILHERIVRVFKPAAVELIEVQTQHLTKLFAKHLPMRFRFFAHVFVNDLLLLFILSISSACRLFIMLLLLISHVLIT